MEELSRKEKLMTGIKILISSVILCFSFFAFVALFYILTKSNGVSILLSMLSEFALFAFFINYIFPVTLKKYIDYYWQKHPEGSEVFGEKET